MAVESSLCEPTTTHSRGRRWLEILVVAATVVAAGVLAATAQETPGATPAVSPTPAGPADEFNRGVPRTAVQGYLEAYQAGDYERAAAYLDLRVIPKRDRKTRGPVLARELGVVLDRTLWVNLELLSDLPEGDTDDGLPKRRDSIGSIKTAKGAVPILLERVPREDGTLIWKISSTTVEQIGDLYQEFGYGPLGELLPAPFVEVRLLQVQLWQWIGLLLLILLAWAISWLVTRSVVRIGRSLLARTRIRLNERLLATAVRPLRLTLAVLLLHTGTFALALSVRAQAVVGGCAEVFTIVAFTWLLTRAVDVLSRMVEDYFAARRNVAVAFVPLGRRSIKVLLVVLAFIVALQNLGFNATSLLAGLGIGGLAVALAAQKTVENLFGSVTLVADQPIRVGDFCRFGDKLGTVEDIGLRSTRIRTLDRTVISVPNADFASMQIENFNRRDRTWLHTTIAVRYETTPDQLRWLLIELRKMLLAHPKVHPDPARVRFVGFSASSLDIEIFAYVLTPDANEFLAIREDIFLRIMDIVKASGSGFAFSSQTVYTPEEGFDRARARAAEAQVQAWRDAGTLCLPDFPPQQVAALDDTLDYPPRGSAVAR